MIQKLLPGYFFALEGYVLYFLLFLLYIPSGKIPPYYAFLVVILLAKVVLLLSLKAKVISFAVPFIGSIICVVIGYLLGLTDMSAVVCALFLFFRISAFIKDSSLWTQERTQLLLLFYCSGIIIFFQGWLYDYSYMNILYGMVLVYTVLFILGRYVQQVEGSTEIKNIYSFLAVLSIVFVLAGVVSTLVPLGKWLFFTVFEGLAVVAAILSKPLLNLFEDFDSKLPVQEQEEEPPLELGELAEENSIQKVIEFFPSWFPFLVVFLVLFGIGLYLKKRKIDKYSNPTETVNTFAEYVSLSAKANWRHKVFRSYLPEEHIRKLFFKLQKYAKKHNMGRYEHETMGEWFERLELPKHEGLLKAYEDVRYGNGVVQANCDEKEFDEIIQILKKEIKERWKTREMQEKSSK